ncbi:Mitochondrial import receptor subunit TOM22 [Orchesella cincta]|uniref:Mitochondrial import receptor subunit TOM22 homolog n=1 Tax=Orchesella cincta TaxID=48709 RepID=A0A1D2MXJ2_ORCCI|nr:Mitochondrial import receptor subunit TOM22 [Orchesella cincta]
MATDEDYTPEDELEETIAERLLGLTEMFPESIRNGAGKTIDVANRSLKKAYGWSRTGVWIFFSTAIIAVAPALFEVERFQMEEMQKMQQRQMLLGPNAAISR